MTTKRDSKRKPEKDDRPKLKKEKLRDLEPEKTGDGPKGGKGGWYCPTSAMNETCSL